MLSRLKIPILCRWCVIAVLTVIVAAVAIRSGRAWAANRVRSAFPQPGYLQPRVQFWVKIFTQYSSRDFVLHDREKVWRIYQVLHLPGVGYPSAAEIARADNFLKTRYERILGWLAAGMKPRSPAQRRVAALIGDAKPAGYRAAAHNLRVQQGLSDQFRKAMARAGRYRGMMERIFSAEGLPRDLILLAAVESGFNPSARSSAGAVGIWQFTRPTGRRFLRINRHRDDRLDPVRSTRAAAKLLHANFERLGSWPLAITAYDYGAGGMAHAAAESDGSYRRILDRWHGPRFGFAARNYYAEFLAALWADRENHYLPGSRDEPKLAAVRHRVRKGDTLSAIARLYNVGVSALTAANGVNPRNLRPGLVLVIPLHAQNGSATAQGARYKVEPGDTLYEIAQKKGVKVQTLIEANDIDDPHALSVGQMLYVPGA